MKRVVIDTSVVTSAFRSSRGASFLVLKLVADCRLIPLVSTALFLEYEDVLQRPDQREAHGLDLQTVSRALKELAALCEAVDPHFRWRPQLSDPADEMVLEVALNGRAECIVTHNIRDFRDAASKFGLPVLTPGGLLQRIEK
jgi:putative PIN family toxin of toxin-antitoxin system